MLASCALPLDLHDSYAGGTEGQQSAQPGFFAHQHPSVNVQGPHSSLQWVLRLQRP